MSDKDLMGLLEDIAEHLSGIDEMFAHDMWIRVHNAIDDLRERDHDVP